jgi:hypothetical protein
MRLEGQHQRRDAALRGNIQRPVQHRLMAAMDAVEIADGDHAAARWAGKGSRVSLR